MKEITNKITSIPSGRPDGSSLTFSDLIRQACDCMPQGGFSPSILRARARIEKALDGILPGDIISLEDSDFKEASSVVAGARWINRHADYIALADAFGVE